METEDKLQKLTQAAEEITPPVTPPPEINGKPLTYKTGEVAQMLDETPAMIRYYCREFEEFLDIEHQPGEHRTYTEKEIKALRYIIYLVKEKNLSVKQAKEFLSTPQGKLMAPLENDEEKAKLLVDVISRQLKEEINAVIRKEMTEAIREIQKPLLALTENTSQTTEEMAKQIEDFLAKNKEEKKLIKEKLEQMEKIMEENKALKEKLENMEKINETVETINQNLTGIDKAIADFRERVAQKEEKKGLFARIFGK